MNQRIVATVSTLFVACGGVDSEVLDMCSQHFDSAVCRTDGVLSVSGSEREHSVKLDAYRVGDLFVLSFEIFTARAPLGVVFSYDKPQVGERVFPTNGIRPTDVHKVVFSSLGDTAAGCIDVVTNGGDTSIWGCFTVPVYGE